MEKDILTRILMSDDVVSSITDNLDIILNLIPELEDTIGFDHNHPHHHLDVWNHTMLALSMAPMDFEIRMALLLHDIGKPHSYQEGEVRHFKNHAHISSLMSFEILNRLHFSPDEVDELCYLIEQHDSLITEDEISENINLAIKKFKIQCCDGLAHNPSKLTKRIAYLETMNERLNSNEEERESYKALLLKF